MKKLFKAAENALSNCIGLKKRDTLMIISDLSTKSIAEAFIKAAHSHNVFMFHLELFGRPIKKLPLVIKKNLENTDIVIFMAESLPDELKTLRRPLRLKALKKKIRFIHMPKITEEIFIDTVGVDYKKIWAMTRKVRNRVSKAKTITVTSKKGTKLTAEFSDSINWVSSDGDFRKFSTERLNLPGAEVLTCPKDVNGVLVVDALISDYFTKKYGLLEKTPLKVHIEKSKIVKAECKNKALLQDFKEITTTDKNSNRVGEFGIGTNIFIKKYYHNFLADEKHPGFHLAFGNPYPERTGAKWKSKIHLDCLIKRSTITIDEKEIILKNDKFKI